MTRIRGHSSLGPYPRPNGARTACPSRCREPRSPATRSSPSDAELIEAVRSGELEAYGLLYRRHAAAAANLARQLTGSRAEADDLVAEAFAKVLDTLRTGGGPDTAFRAYLLTTLRNTLYDRVRRDKPAGAGRTT